MYDDQLNIDFEQNLINSNENNNKKEKSGHIKIHSFEISNEKDFNKIFKINQREQTIQANDINLKNKNRFSSSVRNTAQSEIIEEDLEQKEDYSNNIKITKEKTKNLTNNLNEDKKSTNKIYFYDKIPINILKVITIIMIIIYILIGITSIIFFVKERDNRPFLFCFNFIKRYSEADINQKDEEYDIILFLTDLNSFCIIHVILLFIFIWILVTLFKNQENEIKNFFKNISIFLDLTLLVNIPIFILGIFSDFNDNQYWKIICFIILTGLGTLFMFKIYIKTKSNKFKNISRLINQGLLGGVLTSFELYCFIYNICYITTWGIGETIDFKMEIIPGSIYFVFGFFFTIFYKDIIFSITSLILEIGLLYIQKKEAFSLVIFNICAVFLNFAVITSTIFKYNKKVFNLVEIIDNRKTK